jgi:hypothetical protein
MAKLFQRDKVNMMPDAIILIGIALILSGALKCAQSVFRARKTGAMLHMGI